MLLYVTLGPHSLLLRFPHLHLQHQKDETSNMADLDPKITLLRHKLALVIGEEVCPVYNTIKAQHPNALQEPWSATMDGPYKFVGTKVIPSG